jgi:hypothetical protein
MSLKTMGKLILNHVFTKNIDGNNEFISTGATLNGNEYISLPSILAMYDTSDPTLRKYLKKYGLKDVDYFYCDGKLYIGISFLKKYYFNLKSDNISTYHPYRKKRLVGSILPYQLVEYDSNNITTVRGKIEKELNKINWDYFISINTVKYLNSDDWDYVMEKFIKSLSYQVESKNVCAAFSKEKSINFKATRRKYDVNHSHIHILLYRDSKPLHIDTIKSLFLRSLGKRSFSRNEFHITMFDKNLNGVDYLLKEFNPSDSNFSIIYP